MTYRQVDLALRFAAERHGGQERDGEAPLPYFVHPVEVLLNLRNVGGVTDEPILVAAVLHDLVEETETTLPDIEERFGREVASLVGEVTRYEPSEAELQGLTKDQVWALRSGILLAEIKAMSPAAQSIKLADRLSNLREAARTRTGKKLSRYIAQSQEILEIVPRAVNPALWDAIRQELTIRPAKK